MMEKSSGFLSKMRRSPRGGVKEALSFETLLGHVQSGNAEETRTCLLSQDKAVRVALLQQRDESGWTLFHLACQLGRLQLAFVLLDQGADPNATTPSGATGLHLLALLSREEASPPPVYLQLLAELIRKGALVSLLNSAGESVLHMATSRKNEAAVAFFIEAGCDLNFQSKQGETALHYAVSQNCPSIVSLLLGKGALDRPNSSMVTAEQMAKTKHPELVALFAQPRPARATLNKSQRNVTAAAVASAAVASASIAADQAKSGGRTAEAANDEIVVWEVPEVDPFADDEKNKDDEAGVVEGLDGLTVHGCWEVYRNEFFGKRHFVYHGAVTETEERALAVVLSRPGSDGFFRGLLIVSGDWSVFSFHSDLLGLYAAHGDESEQIRHALATTKMSDVVGVWNVLRSSNQITGGAQLLALEAKLGTRPRFCVGVVLGLAGQTKEAEMFENTDMTPEFEAFLDVLGEQVEMDKWRHWKGTLNGDESVRAVYTCWRGFEFVFHVSTFLDAAKQRQHIGNDTVLLFYKHGSEKMESAFRGKVNACALVLTPSEKQGNKALSLSAFYRKWVEGFSPTLPHRAISMSSEQTLLRNVLFTNIVNASAAALRSGPYKQNRHRLYDAAIAELVSLDDEASGNVGSSASTQTAPSSPAGAASAAALQQRKKIMPEKVSIVTEKAVVAIVPTSAVAAAPVINVTTDDSASPNATSSTPGIKSGWLQKRKNKAGKKGGWKKRFCVLREDGLSYYEKEHDEQRMGLLAYTQVQFDKKAIEIQLSHPLMYLNCVSGEYDFALDVATQAALPELRSWAQLIASKASVVLTEQKVTNSGPPPPRPTTPSKRPPANTSAPTDDANISVEKMSDLITAAMHYIHRKGLYRPNIFRVNEDQSEVDALSAAWARGARTDLEKESVDVVAGSVRKFFRDVASLLSGNEVDALMDSTRQPPQQQMEVARRILCGKPLLMNLFELLNKVDENSSVNKMTASNLAAVFAPSFLREVKNVALLLEYTKAIVSVVQFVISHFSCCSFKEPTGKWSHRAVEEDDDDTASIPVSEIVLEVDLEDFARLEQLRIDRARKASAADSAKPPLPVLPTETEVVSPKAHAVAPPSMQAPVKIAPTKKKAPSPPKAPAPKPSPRQDQVADLGHAPTPAPRKPSFVPAMLPPLVPPIEEEEEVVLKSPTANRAAAAPAVEQPEDTSIPLVPALEDPFD